MSIPKIIHYCWFGGNEIPERDQKCIASWKKYCPDYEIIKWSEDNFDMSAAPLYVRQAYEAKKWAFVTDYVRLWAMVKFGGIYMDTDVELIRPVDRFLTHRAFSGFEDGTRVPTGIMACEKNFALFELFLRYYDNALFFNADSTINCTTNVTIITDICLQHGLQQNGEYQEIEGMALYPKEYFCPKVFMSEKVKITKNTYSIHHFHASWQTDEEKKELKKYKRYTKIFGEKLGELVYQTGKNLKEKGLTATIRKITGYRKKKNGTDER